MSHRFLERDVLDAARAHARERYPAECCGAVTVEGYLPLQNVARVPLMEFDCDRQVEELLESGTELLALVHSHPLLFGRNDPARGPSELDVAQQIAMDVPWGITLVSESDAAVPYFWGDALEPPPLEGRLFRHGPSGTDGKGDCGALIKDWYRVNRGMILKEIARGDGWWEPGTGKALYDDHYAERGFRPVDRREPEVGDLVLMRVLAKVSNHAGVYIGNGLIMHHLARRISRIEPIIGWMGHVTNWLRHAGP